MHRQAGRTESCSDTERQRVKTQITAYINTAPAPAAKTAENWSQPRKVEAAKGLLC
jgi:hypothetical protein